jgi:hypothetical protein
VNVTHTDKGKHWLLCIANKTHHFHFSLKFPSIFSNYHYVIQDKQDKRFVRFSVPVRTFFYCWYVKESEQILDLYRETKEKMKSQDKVPLYNRSQNALPLRVRVQSIRSFLLPFASKIGLGHFM